jgi:hypothetical protein
MQDASSLLFSLEWQYSQYELHIHDLGVNIGILSRVLFTFLVILFLVLMQTVELEVLRNPRSIDGIVKKMRAKASI